MQLAAHVWLTSVVGSNIQFPTLNLCVHSQHLHLCHETPVQSPDTALNLNMQKLQLKFRVSSRGLSELLYFTPSPESPRGPRGSNLGTNSRTDEHGKKMPFNQNWVMPAFSKCFCHPKKNSYRYLMQTLQTGIMFNVWDPTQLPSWENRLQTIQ